VLAGKSPFSGAQYHAQAKKELAHMQLPAPPINQHRPEIPAGLGAILQRMLAKDPARRFATPHEVAQALQPFAHGCDCKKLLARARQCQGTATRPTALDAQAIYAPTLTATRARGPIRWPAILGVCGLLAAALAVAFVLLGGDPGDDASGNDAKANAIIEPVPQPGAWFNLLKREPAKLLWQDYKHNHKFLFSPDKSELMVYVPNESLLSFAKTDRAGYRVQIGISQVRWDGGVGLFFGYHPTVFNNRECFKYQLLEVNRFGGGFVLERSWGTAEPTANPALPNRFMLASADVGVPTDRVEYVLEIEVRPAAGLADVKWNGLPLPALCAHDRNNKFLPEDYCGDFGAFNRRSTSVFGNARLMLFERISR
jgi:eukaryotic-like serine/threonine-protein kinase